MLTVEPEGDPQESPSTSAGSGGLKLPGRRCVRVKSSAGAAGSRSVGRLNRVATRKRGAHFIHHSELLHASVDGALSGYAGGTTGADATAASLGAVAGSATGPMAAPPLMFGAGASGNAALPPVKLPPFEAGLCAAQPPLQSVPAQARGSTPAFCTQTPAFGLPAMPELAAAGQSNGGGSSSNKQQQQQTAASFTFDLSPLAFGDQFSEERLTEIMQCWESASLEMGDLEAAGLANASQMHAAACGAQGTATASSAAPAGVPFLSTATASTDAAGDKDDAAEASPSDGAATPAGGGAAQAALSHMSFQFCSPLHVAAFCGHREVVESFVASMQGMVGARNASGCTPLHFAAHQGQAAVVARLLKVPACKVDAADNFGRTALHYASAMGRAHVVDLLWAAGCNIDPLDFNGMTGDSLYLVVA